MLTLIADYAIPALRAMDPASVQTVVTSIPYWSLRDYGIAPVVWDDFVACEHEWESASAQEGYTGKRKWQHHTNNRGEDAPEHKRPRSSTTREIVPGAWDKIEQGSFCRICDAWLGSWGLEPTPELYVQHTVQVFREVRRVLRRDGTLWLNIGDCYAGGGRGGQSEDKRSKNWQPSYASADGALRSSRHNQREALAGAVATAGHSFRRDRKPQGDVRHKEAPGVKPKDLVGLPWMVAFALRADGWYLRSDVVWFKPNAMPESCRDRPTRAHEFMFLFSRSGASTYWTHRDLPGEVFKQPKADYRWVHANGEEMTGGAGGP